MKKDIAEHWVKELRSDKYKKGRSYLNVNDYYCCLGVLCDMASREGIVKADIDPRDDDRIIYNDSHSVLPREVMEWAGMKTDVGGLRVPVEGYSYLAGLNDFVFDTFDPIADVIERQWESL